jgi:hypothetical protein
MPQISLGFRVHSGWAIMIAFADNTVIERRRIELAADGMPVQPYHAAEPLLFAEAERLIRRSEESSRQLAIRALKPFAHARAASVLSNSGRPLPDLQSILRSHALIHAAEGELYREALRHAAQQFGIRLINAKEKEIFAQLPPEVHQQIAEYAKILGPPWRQDEKLAAAAAYVAQVQGKKE